MISTLSIRSATDLAYKGDFASAIRLLGPSWQGLGVNPARNGEGDHEYAELLLACGVLSVEMGRFQAIPCQSEAKDLLSHAARLFGNDPMESEVRLWLAIAYVRSGENSEAVAICDSIIAAQTADIDTVFGAGRVKGLAHLNFGRLDCSEEAFRSVEIFVDSVAPISRGKFYLSRGILYRQSRRFADALADYELADDSFRDAESPRYQAAVQNNIAGVYSEQGRFSDAHASAQRSLLLFEQIGDLSHEAKVWDQIAQIFLLQGKYDEAARCSARAVEILSTGDHEGWLAEALITHGIALSRVAMAQAHESLDRALHICERLGDPKQAEIATAAMWEIVKRSHCLQEGLRQSASPIERAVYERALAANDGRVSPAARALGYNHQAFMLRLESHFPELLSERRPPRKRRKAAFRSK